MNTSLEDTLKELFHTYSKNLKGKIDEIENTWNMFQLTLDENTLKLLKVKVHNLKGSSGTYGFNEIFAIIEKIEASMDKLIKELSNTAIREQIENDLHHLRQAFLNVDMNTTLNEFLKTSAIRSPHEKDSPS